MDHSYGFWADVRSKFQTAPPAIQALWLVLVAVVLICAVWAVADVARVVVSGSRRKPKARVVYGLVQDDDGRWLVCIEGDATRVEAATACQGGSIAGPPEDLFGTPILPPRR